MSLPDWLPVALNYDDFGGDFEKFLDVVYSQFIADFLEDLDRGTLNFRGMPLRLRRHPLVKNKEKSFWHLISSGDLEDERLIEFDRCECISWAKAILNNSDDPQVKVWENKRWQETNICIWLEEAGYVVVLGKRNDYYLLLTAYFPSARRCKAFLNEYNAFKSLKP